MVVARKGMISRLSSKLTLLEEAPKSIPTARQAHPFALFMQAARALRQHDSVLSANSLLVTSKGARASQAHMCTCGLCSLSRCTAPAEHPADDPSQSQTLLANSLPCPVNCLFRILAFVTI